MLVLAGCQAPSPQLPPLAASAPAALPVGKLYRIDPQASEIRLLIYRDGPMARFGHNHVVSGKVNGEISLAGTAAGSGFRIEVPVESLMVDPAALRGEEGQDFEAAVSGAAQRDTRKNMLGPDVLDAARHPVIAIHSIKAAGPRWNPDITAQVTLHGRSSEVSFPAAVIEQADALIVIARFELLQTRLGLQPYSVLGGAIRVRDAIEVRMRLVARPSAR